MYSLLRNNINVRSTFELFVQKSKLMWLLYNYIIIYINNGLSNDASNANQATQSTIDVGPSISFLRIDSSRGVIIHGKSGSRK